METLAGPLSNSQPCWCNPNLDFGSAETYWICMSSGDGQREFMSGKGKSPTSSSISGQGVEVKRAWPLPHLWTSRTSLHDLPGQVLKREEKEGQARDALPARATEHAIGTTVCVVSWVHVPTHSSATRMHHEEFSSQEEPHAYYDRLLEMNKKENQRKVECWDTRPSGSILSALQNFTPRTPSWVISRP